MERQSHSRHYAVGRYRVERELARGGLGIVYVARDETSGRHVALKRLRSREQSASSHAFEREYQTLSHLSHPSVIEVFDFGIDAEGPYYAMELLEGSDLQELAPMPAHQVCRCLRDVASSLAVLHARHLVHRDVSPRNIRLTLEGRAKLIDFGALTDFGRACEVVGTPPCVPPEALRGGQLDHRTDLFALGAVAYFVLTGRHAYWARKFTQLQSAWRERPALPSTLAPDVPPALDELVMELLSLDPVGRPQSAGEVIARLNAIGRLPPEEGVEAAASSLLRPRLCGRDREMAALRAGARSTLEGRGCAMVVVGDEGQGKSRLLADAMLEAQLAGLCAVSAETVGDQAAFSLVRSICRGLLASLPELTRTCLGPHAAVLGHLLPELRRAEDAAPGESFPGDPAERRARIQRAFIEGLLAICEQHPLALAIDDVHEADAGSAAVLGALSRKIGKRKLLLLTSAARGRVLASGVELLLSVSDELALSSLSPEDLERLVRSMFGDVPDVGRLASRLHALSGGNPMQCMALAHHICEAGLVRYREGTWVVVQEPSDEHLPASLSEAWDARLNGLSDAARELCELLAIHRSPASAERCLALYGNDRASALLGALDELLHSQLIALGAEGYRFTHESLLRHAASRMSEAHRRALHARIAAALDTGDPLGSLEVARHLFEAGAEVEGADRLAAIAYRLAFETDGLAGAAKPLERALEVCTREGRSPYRTLWLHVALCQLGWISHPRHRLAHQDRAIDALGKATGLTLAGKLARVVGARLGLVLAIGWTSVTTWRERRGTDCADFDRVFVALSRSASALMASAGVCMDRPVLERMLGLLAPLQVMSGIGRFVYEYCKKIQLLIVGCEPEALALCERNAAMLDDPQALPELAGAMREIHRVGALHTLGICRALATDPTALDAALALHESSSAFYRSASGQLRVTFYGALGDSERVAAELAGVELDAIGGGSSWSNEVLLPIVLLPSHDLAENVVELQRAHEALSRWAESIPSLAPYAEGARLMFAAARGHVASEREAGERWVAAAGPGERIGWAHGRAVLMRIYNQTGEHALARRLGEESVAQMHPGARAFATLYLELERQLALADAGLGRFDAARERLEELLEEVEPRRSPLHQGLLHEALCEVAWLCGDEEAFRGHLQRAQDMFRATRNARLLARVERLSARMHTSAVDDGADDCDVGTVIEPELDVELQRVIVGDAAPDVWAGAALSLIVDRLGAEAGYLYRGDADALELIAHSGGDAQAATTCALRMLSERRELSDCDDDDAATGANTATLAVVRSGGADLQVLALELPGGRAAVGALVLQAGRALPSVGTMATLARALA